MLLGLRPHARASLVREIAAKAYVFDVPDAFVLTLRGFTLCRWQGSPVLPQQQVRQGSIFSATASIYSCAWYSTVEHGHLTLGDVYVSAGTFRQVSLPPRLAAHAAATKAQDTAGNHAPPLRCIMSSCRCLRCCQGLYV
jgi:hypothetical protein